jgi:membrane protein
MATTSLTKLIFAAIDGRHADMAIISKRAAQVIKHPAAFALLTLNGFRKNQGLLLAGAVAYYALLSIIPALILCVIALSHWVDQGELLATLGRSLEWLVPSQSQAFLADLSGFLDNRVAIGTVLLVTMLFFSSVAFSVLENAMVIIFSDHAGIRKRHFMVSAILPYCFILLLASTLLGVTLISVTLQALARESVHLFGRDWSLGGLSGALLYLLGVTVETFIVAAIYLVMPIRRIPLGHALIGGFTATVLWEVIRHGLIWYFATLSKASVVYGSLTTAVIALFSMEIAATLLLLGAQVISEYQRLESPPA